MMVLFEIVIIIYSIILHEIAHGLVANSLGDPTAKASGRLTLNPIPHIDPLMTIALPLLLYFIGSPFIFGGAKPVPIDPFNFRNPKRDIALTSAAGPITNIFLAIIFGLVLRLGRYFILDTGTFLAISQILFYAVLINLFLGLFNLLPIPPLDGFKIIGGILPNSLSRFWFSLERFGFLFLLIILFYFSSIISSVIYPITNFLINYLK